MASRNRVNAAIADEKRRAPKLGQHFLADRGIAEKIVSALGAVAAETVLEVGPGKGVLTTFLAKKASKLIAIELDRVLAAQLRMKYAVWPNVEIIEGDILTIDLSTVLGPRPGALAGVADAPKQMAQVIGNIPYYITSDILLRLFSYHAYLQRMVIMVQEEVADRIAAKPGGKDYGLLSATAQLYAKIEKLFTVAPDAFLPPPHVRSAVLRLTVAPQWERLQVPEREFIEFLKLSFGQKRKTLVNNLKPRYNAALLQQALKRAGVRADARSETLPLEKAAAMFRFVQGKGIS